MLRSKQGQFCLVKKASTIQYGHSNVEFMLECFPKHSRMGTGSLMSLYGPTLHATPIIYVFHSNVNSIVLVSCLV